MASSSSKRTLEAIAAAMTERREREAEARRIRERQRQAEPHQAKPIAELSQIAPPKEQGLTNFRLEDTLAEKGGSAIKIGKAYRRKPMIDVLREKGILTYDEHKALKHYRHHADMTNRSLIRDSLCIERFGGNGNGPTRSVLNAIQVTNSCENAAGILCDILRAVVVDDLSLSQWAIKQAGAIEDCSNGVCRLKPRQRALEIAKLEIRIVAERVRAELDA